jgi:L-fucose isomerase-like protein
MKFQILGLRSAISPENEVNRVGSEYISALAERVEMPMEWVSSPDEFSDDAVPLIFVQTGGTEGMFAALLEKIPQPVALLTHGAMNSLAASLEILTYLQQKGMQGEVIHGELDYVAERLINLQKIAKTRQYFNGAKLGVIGKPSDWLIASQMDKDLAREKLGCEIVDIPIDELIQLSRKDYKVDGPLVEELKKRTFPAEEMTKALNIYGALRELVKKYQLSGLTVRCFDLLDPLESTGCIGLALLNAEGIPSSCEGDVPALITMMMLQSLVGEPGFMVNPSRIMVQENKMVVAHCTLPINMGGDYKLKTHYESGIGVAVDGQLPEQKAMMFKVSADLERYFVSQIEILSNLSEKNLCRTQIEISLKEDVRYFLNDPCGNHHIITLENRVELIKDFMRSL